ncbi:glycosyltransferase [Kineococcus aurantiacus]|uniref:Glycosyltransferase involved in cell wall biosynthesis n=1 Tax=Kineococcus aurantiacus TaxID=37633 RepID=A0A7Y9AS42_9ACTN|nr:glycosyltransferase involved in cell wall biosynthesis [Kineococcus aurantiacus]
MDARVLTDKYHGIGRVLDQLLQRLVREPDLELVLFHSGERSQRFDVERFAAFPSVELRRFDLSMDSPRQTPAWWRAARAAGVDLVFHPYHVGAPLVGRGRRAVLVHDCILEADRRFAPAGVRLPYMALTAAVVRTSEVFTVSRASAEALRSTYRVPVSLDRVVHNGVAEEFARARPLDATARADLGLPERFVLTVGARRPHKDVATVVRALPMLPPDVHLVMVGNVDARLPDEVPGVIDRLGVAGRVHHVPFVPEEHLPGLYATADALVYPSLVEGFGLPMLEAMAAGTPVVASDIPVFREVGAEAALFAAPGDAAAWAQQVRRLSGPYADDELRRSLVSAGRSNAAGYRWDTAASNLLQQLRRAGRRRPSVPAR